MNTKIILLLFVLFSFAVVNAQESSHSENKIDKNNSLQVIKEKYIKSNDYKENKDLTLNFSDSDSTKLKSPVIGAVMSAVIPGSGQIYAKNYLKSAIFIAAEAGLWALYAVFQGKGNDQTDAYEKYANENWNMRKYAQWLKDQSFQGSDGIDLSKDDETLRMQINVCEERNFSHQLPRKGEQQYYEVIGKYQNYVTGWSTADVNVINKNNYGTYHLPQVSTYMDDRQTANDYYNKGTTALMVVILNHIVSAVDGVLSVNSYNNKYVLKGSVSFQPVYSHKTGRSLVTPFANVSFTF